MSQTPPLFRTFALTALTFTGIALGLAAGTAAFSHSKNAADLPIRCGVDVTTSGSSRIYQGVLQAREAVSGSYEFRVTKTGGGGSATLNQSGPFTVAAGDRATLGQASFGRPAQVNAKLVLHWNGMELRCASPSDI